MDNARKASIADCEARIAKLSKEHDAAIKKSRKQSVDDLATIAKNKALDSISWWKKGGLWLVSGLPGAIATLLLTVIAYGLLMWFMPPEHRANAVANMVNATTGEKTVVPFVDPSVNQPSTSKSKK